MIPDRIVHAAIVGIAAGISALAAPAQNLVPNPSFEEMVSCPYAYSQLDFTMAWFSPTDQGTPDYYHACSTGYGVPDNVAGSQPAHEGDAYVAIYLYIQDPPEAREYVEVELSQPLEAGQCYAFSMHASLADVSLWTTDDIGMHLSTTSMSGIPGYPPLLLPADVWNDSGVLLDDSTWNEVSGNFTADGGEQFLIIGNFNNDVNTTIVPHAGAGWNSAYCYVDDISLTPCTGEGLPTIPEGADLLIPDPSGAGFLLTSSVPPHARLRVLDSRGVLVQEGRALPYARVDLSARADGLYIVEVSAPGLIVRTRFIKQGR